jgi:hypothetical protein
MIDLAQLGRAELAAIDEAGRELEEWQRIIAKSGDSILGLVLGATGDAMADWSHYPPGDVYDPATHAQYFYHRHAPGPPCDEEHGHFHTYMRPRGMPPGTRPLVMPELAIAGAPAQPLDPVSPPARQPNQGDGNDKFSHLIAVGMDAAGAPIRLFTTNRWVTGETWYAAEDVIRMLDGFSIELARPYWPLNRWLCALMRFYRPDIVLLLRARDAAVMSWRRRHRGKVHVFEDQRLEIVSAVAIDPTDRRRRLADMLGRAA